MLFYIVELVIVGLLVWQAYDNKWAWLNAKADEFERKVPMWLRWEMWGDPISWFQHASGAAGVGVALGLLSKLLEGSFTLGLRHGTALMLVFYLVREGYGFWLQRGDGGKWWRGAPHYTGWVVDGVMDVVIVAMVTIWAWS